MATYGQQIMLARRDRKWTQEECADKLGISRNWLSQIELDKLQNLSLHVAAKIAEVLNVRHPLMDVGLEATNNQDKE